MLLLDRGDSVLIDRMFDRGTGERDDPEGVGEAVRALRIQLLGASIGYGVSAVLSEGDTEAVREWREWLDWTRGVISAFRREAGETPWEMPPFLDQGVAALDVLERAGEPIDRFGDETVRDWAREEFERLAERARPIERVKGEPLGEVEDRPSRAGMRLFGAVMDSLVFASSEDEEIRRNRASAAEIHADLVAARKERVWDFLLGAA